MTRFTRRGTFGLATLPLLARPALAKVSKNGARPGPYLIGADISWVPEDEAAMVRYFVDGARDGLCFVIRRNDDGELHG